MNNSLISVIIPIYNVEPYLKQCINSIVNQSYTNLEIILVDDGSPDRCPQICDEYAAKDKRIVVIHKENGGLSDARNAGLDICKGDYLYFLDSDDIIPSHCISILFKIITQEKAEIAASSYSKFSDEHLLPDNPIHDISYTTMDGCEALIQLCRDETPGIMSACMKIYKKELFQEVRFPIGKLYEDAHTNYKIYHKCKKICYTSVPLYYYRIRKGSIMASTKSPIYDLEVRESRYLFLKEHNEPAAIYCIEYLCWGYLWVAAQPPAFFNTNKYFTTPKDALNHFKNFTTTFLKTKQGSPLHRFLLRVFFLFPKLYILLYKLSPWHIRKVPDHDTK